MMKLSEYSDRNQTNYFHDMKASPQSVKTFYKLLLKFLLITSKIQVESQSLIVTLPTINKPLKFLAIL